jgi:hypothetical protein
MASVASHGRTPGLARANLHVGDSESDMEAAARAGCRSPLVQRGAFLQHGAVGGTFKKVVSDLLEAASLIVRRDTPTLDETLRRDLPHLHSAWHAVSQISNSEKSTQE